MTKVRQSLTLKYLVNVRHCFCIVSNLLKLLKIW